MQAKNRHSQRYSPSCSRSSIPDSQIDTVMDLIKCRAGFGHLILSLMLPMAGCTTMRESNAIGSSDVARVSQFSPKVSMSQEPILLQLKNTMGREERIRHQSQSITKKYEGTQLLNERLEIADFVIRSTTQKKATPGAGPTVLLETISKDGPIDLHDLAFPELGEKLEMDFTPNAEVIKAGRYPKESIFFVPPLSLPSQPVRVGDTWTLKKGWLTAKNGTPLEVDLVSIFKGLFQCGVDDQCAEIETSGVVYVPKSVSGDVTLESRIVGRMLFSIKTGTVIWTDVRNQEKLTAGNWKIEVSSCLESVLEFPERERWMWRQQPKCDPASSPPDRVPGL